MANCELPEDVVFHILLLLPVVSLLRFRSVCKSWCNLIDSSTFITKHFLLHQEHHDSLIVYDRHGDNWYVLSAAHHLCTDISANLPRNFKNQPWEAMRLIGSCNGLVCIQDVLFYRVALWNPATRKLTYIPDSPVPTSLGHDFGSRFGFGYDVKTNDYKVIKITRIYPRHKEENRIEIYDLYADSWRTYNADLPGGVTGYDGIYCNGTYCWTIRDPIRPSHQTKYSILSFDLSNEVLRMTEFPKPVDLCYLRLTVVTDCIAFVEHLGSWQSNPACRHYEIWVLKECGIKESWTKLYTIGPIGPLYSVLETGFFSKGDFFLFMFKEKMENEDKFLLASCDPIVLDMQYLEVPYSGQGCPSVFVYKESLVSVKRGNGKFTRV